MLFVYGERKPFMFHSQPWLDSLATQPGCRVVAMPEGHWMMVRGAETLNRAILEWLEPGASPARSSVNPG